MKFLPKTYQKAVINKIINQEACAVFLTMGLGKSIATLTAITELMYDRFFVNKTLIIAPKRVCQTTWPDEIEKWEHTKILRPKIVLGTEHERIEALNSKADVYLINRENVEWLVSYYGKAWPFEMVVIDESSSFKSAKSKRFKALRKVLPLSEKKVLLTGTPQPNGLMDLWAQIYLLDFGERLGRTLTEYRTTYFTEGKRYGNVVYDWRPKPQAQELIYRKIKDLCMTMKAEDYIQLPKLIINTVEVVLPPKARHQYKYLAKESILEFSTKESIVAGSKAVLGNKLLQLANGAVYGADKQVIPIHDEKLKALEELIENANNNPVLIFYNYKHDEQRITDYLTKRQYLVRKLNNSQDVQGWNENKIPIMLAHPASAGHGLNLQYAANSTMVWFGLTWSLELYKQACARLYRQGRKTPLIIHHILTKGTKEKNVLEVLNRKDADQEALFTALEIEKEFLEEKNEK